MQRHYEAHRNAIDSGRETRQRAKYDCRRGSHSRFASEHVDIHRRWNRCPGGVPSWANCWLGRSPVYAHSENELSAIGKSQAVIEFELDGTIITANDNFLNALGYSLEEIKGQHHRMFCDPATPQSAEYRSSGTSSIAASTRPPSTGAIGKGGKEIWIQASYNPILDANGKPYKVVKYATDITRSKELRNADYQGSAGRDRQVAGRDRIQAGRHDHHGQRELPEDARLLAGRNQGPAPPDVRASRAYAASAEYKASGTRSIAASTRPPSTSGSARAARKSGSRPPTTRSSTSTASRSRWSSTPRTSPSRRSSVIWQAAQVRRSRPTKMSKSRRCRACLSAVAGGDLTQHYEVAAADEDTARGSQHFQPRSPRL